MPLQLWVQAARAGLRVKEVGVPRLYLDPNRAFGGMLDDAAERLAYYRRVIAAAEVETSGAIRAPRSAGDSRSRVAYHGVASSSFGLFPKRACR